MGLRVQPFASAETVPWAALDLFSFEEMTTLSNEARILSLLAHGNAGPTLKSRWLDVSESGIRAADFKLLAAHPRLLHTARQALNGPVHARSVQLCVADSGSVAVAASADGLRAVVCLAGIAAVAAPTMRAGTVLHDGSVLWARAGDDVVLEPGIGAPPPMICAITYAALAQAAYAAGVPQELQAVADDSLWPSAYVMAG